MVDVKPGDRVLTKDHYGSPFYDEVIMMIHRSQHQIVDNYVQVIMSTNNKLVLSRLHLVLLQDGSSKFSKDLSRGDKMLTYDSLTKRMQSSSVIDVRFVTRIGMFAPLTKSGTIIVDDVYVSCYALFPSHRVSHAVFWLWRCVYDLFKYFDPTVGSVVGSDTIHWYPKFFKERLQMFNVFHYIL